MNSSAGGPVIEAVGLVKRYGRRVVVDGLDLMVERGLVYGFLGPNGAGKSTTIRMLLGLIRPAAGQLRLLGHEVSRARTAALRRVGAQVDTPAFYRNLSGLRNLRMLAQLTGPVTAQEIDRVLDRVRLKGREGDKVRTYSQGMRARLGLAQALLPRPEVLILDEPTNGLDPQGMKEVRDLILSLAKDDGITVFLSSHLLGEVQQVCDRVAVINHGRLVCEGEVGQLLAGAAAGRCRVVAEPLDVAVATAEAVSGGPVAVDGRTLTVSLADDRVPDLNAALVAAGAQVYELVPQRINLEEFFLSVTSGGDS